jgi:hypothetical protein
MTYDERAAAAQTQRRVRYAAAALTALIAALYVLIGFNVLTVLDAPGDQSFGFFAGAGYGLGMILLLSVRQRWVWMLGAVLQVFVMYTYFNLAVDRSPAYETWGIVLRVAQGLVLVALLYLALRVPDERPAESVPGEV